MLPKLIVQSLIIALLLSIAPCFAETFSGEVVHITDGDTIQVMHNGQAEKIRLSGIDAPEKTQPFGQSAKEYAASLCFRKLVSVTTFGQDRYHRTIADIQLPNGTILNNELVRAGYAWWYRRYAPNNTTLQQLETSARLNHAGLWAGLDPVEPWDYRHYGTTASLPEQPVAPAGPPQQNPDPNSALHHALQGVVQQSSIEPLKGEIQRSETTPLKGRVDEQAIPPVDLRAGVPNKSAIMHIVQYKQNDATPNSAPLPLLQGTIDRAPVRDTNNLLQPPLRGTADGEHPPSRATKNNQLRAEVIQQPPQRPDIAAAPVRSAASLEDRPPTRHIDDSLPSPAYVAPVPTQVPSIAQTTGVTYKPSLPDRIKRRRDLPDRSHELRVKRKPEKSNEADIAPSAQPQTAPIEESLLWDRWYKHVNELVCAQLTRTMPAHRNPAGSLRVQITVWPNHHMRAIMIQGSNQRFNDAVLEAYSSLDGNQDLEFPQGTHRQLIEYETDHIQDIPAVTSAFDSQTIHGDLELVK